MGRLACIFPGQGSQSVGMGLDLFERHEESRKAFERIDEIAGRKLTELCFEGPADALKKTINTQPTILAVSLAAWAAYENSGGPVPDFVAGHSLGEISALVAASALSLENAVKLVEKRASLMESCPPGAMAAVLKIDAKQVETVLAGIVDELDKSSPAGANEENVLVMANYNTREQLVISGSPLAVKEACARIKSSGGRAIPLPVGGAFHSPLMREAAEQFSHLLSEIELADAGLPVVQNLDARPSRTGPELKKKLDMQMVSPVRWYESIELMVAEGVDTFVEIGPGNVLQGLVSKIAPQVRVLGISDSASLESTIAELAGVGAR